MFTRVHSCSLVFTRVHSCSDSCGVLEQIGLDMVLQYRKFSRIPGSCIRMCVKNFINAAGGRSILNSYQLIKAFLIKISVVF